MTTQLYTYVTIDNKLYAIASGSYVRDWARFFSSQPVANIIRINYVDRGPGIKTYTMTLILANWDSSSLPYQAGITSSALSQLSDLETSYKKIATPLEFLDPFGNPPTLNVGVYFTDMIIRVPNYATDKKPYVLCDITLQEASGTTI